MKKKVIVIFEYESTSEEQDAIILTHVQRSVEGIFEPLEENGVVELEYITCMTHEDLLC